MLYQKLSNMCGIVGLIGIEDAAKEAFLGLTTLQHRGQDAAGILTHDDSGFHTVKNLGLVDSVFTKENMAKLTGQMAIGHVRYSTIGQGGLDDVQPLALSYPFGLGIVHNGNVVNCKEISKDLRLRSKRHAMTSSDTETLLHLFADSLASAKPGDSLAFDDICKAVRSIFLRANGSYSIITLVADYGLIAFRDPWGIRPLVWGRKGHAHMVASESSALSFAGFEIERNVQPGEVIFINKSGEVFSRVVEQRGKKPCMFEWVYFASPESVIDEVAVYAARIRLGRNLARLIKDRMHFEGISADIIVPIPETSRIAAISLAEELKIPYRELLIKNRYIKRTFILDSAEKRQKAVNLKLAPVKSELKGKKVLLIDDSIVRGTTSSKIVEIVRQAGAEKVFLVSTCPPIKYPCFYGIDFPNQDELVASRRDEDALCKVLKADKVIYQDLDGLADSISINEVNQSFCMACLTGEYPCDVSAGKAFLVERNKDRSSRAES